MKEPEYAKVWVTFGHYNGQWNISAYTYRPTPSTTSKYYEVELPVPEELLHKQLPNKEKIKMEKKI